MRIGKITIKEERSILDVRYAAKSISKKMGFTDVDCIRIATASSELTRNIYEYASEGEINFEILKEKDKTGLKLVFKDKGEGIKNLDAILSDKYKSKSGMGIGIKGAKNLMDEFQIDSQQGKGTTVSVIKWLQRGESLSEQKIKIIQREVELITEKSALESLNLQNRELIDILNELKNKNTQLKSVNKELEETNTGMVALYKEIDQKNDELEEANRRLKEADRLKSAFLANMSHELRTPLNSIIGFTGIILKEIVGKLNEEQKKQLNMAYDSAKHLLELINDVLDLSKIEAGKIEIIPVQFEVKELFGMVEKMVSPMIEEKGLKLQIGISGNVPQTIYHDKNRIKQVLINLLSNANKFTESGEICMSVRPSLLSAGSSAGEFDKEDITVTDPNDLKDKISSMVFSVSDTGIGIKAENLPEIFDEFRQLEGPLKEKPIGTGLGLPISKKMVEMMGGCIWAKSEYGKGSLFQFSIPVKESPDKRRKIAVEPDKLDKSKKLVLTIDDEFEAQEILKTYLKDEGYEVIQAYNALESMEFAKKYNPFAITLDIIMPGKDGWDILKELKEDPQTENIPVICISILDNRQMGLSLGAFEYMTKPVSEEQLIKELRRLEKRFKIYDILLVDDDYKIVELLSDYIVEANDYTIRKAYNGKEALSKINRKSPDLIILDLIMPEMDGFEVIENLKKSEKTKDIPVIILSAKKLSQEETAFLNSNIEKIIRKGDFLKDELLGDIKRALEKIGK